MEPVNVTAWYSKWEVEKNTAAMTVKWALWRAIQRRPPISLHDYERRGDRARRDNDADAAAERGG